MTVLKEEFPDLTETPLVKDGLIRSVKLGDKLFDEINSSQEFKEAGNQAVMIAIDSGRDRAELTRALATYRVSQLESKSNKGKQADEQIRIDMLHLSSEEIAKMLADADASTWDPYDKMMQKGATEGEAILQWLKDMNQPGVEVEESKLPKEAGERYRQILKDMRQKVTAKDVPLFIFGAGHSGSLGQIQYEKQGGEMKAGDTPQFCEMYQFDKNGELVNTKQVNI